MKKRVIRWPFVIVTLVALGVVVSALAQYYGEDWRQVEKKRKEILAKIPTQHDILINVTSDLMPGTPELTALGRKATPALTRGLLDNADDGVRSICAGVLAEIRDPAAAPGLRDALSDRNITVRAYAVYGLGMLALPEYGKYLEGIVLNPEEDRYVKYRAIEAIGNMGYVKAMGTLVKLIRDPGKDNLQWEAMAALWHMRNRADRGDLESAFLYVLEKELPGAEAAVDYLGRLGATKASGTLVKYNIGRNEWVKNQVILSMGKIGDSKARSFLKDVMKSTQVARHLNNAAIALAELGDKPAAEAILVELLKDRKAYLRVNAAFALGEIEAQSTPAIEGLVAALSDPNDYVRSEAAVALGRLKAKGGEEALLKLAASDNPFVQLDAVVALTRIDYKTHRHLVFERLFAHKQPKFQRVVQRGIRILAEQGDPEGLPFLLAQLRTGANNYEVLTLLLNYKKEQVSEFLPSLSYLAHTTNYGDFQVVMRILREWKLTDMTPGLLERLYRSSPWGADRPLLYFTLGKVAAPELAPTLRKVEEQLHTNVLYKTFALANLGDEEALGFLLSTMENGTLGDKRDSAFLLGGLDGAAAAKAAPRLKQLMTQADPYTAVAAAAALVNQGDEEAIAFLYKVMKEGIPVVADEAERALLVAQNSDVDKFLRRQNVQEKQKATQQRSFEILYQRNQKDFR